MQQINPTLPIPPGLKAPVPKTPWNISPALFDRIQKEPSDPSDAFRRCVVLPSDPEAAFVLQYFMHQKPHNYGIKAIYCIHNPVQTSSFESTIEVLEQEAKNPVFSPKGKEEEPQKDRAKVIERWKECTTSFSPVKIKRPPPKRTDTFTEVKVLPLWHGSTQEKCTSICTSGFTFFGKHEGTNSSTDDGYFGSGMYFTNSARYASMYSSGHLLLGWVSMREPYPVVNDVPLPNQGSDMKALRSKGAYENYNAHYIPVASTKPNKPDWMIYYPCYQDQPPAWDEFVVFNKNQTVARFWVELCVDSPPDPFSPIKLPPYITPSPVSILPPPSDMLKTTKAPAMQAATEAPVKGGFAYLQKKNKEPLKASAVQAATEAQPVAPVQTAKAPTHPAWVFGASEWNKYFGDVGAEPPLPDDIVQRLPELSVNNVLVLIPATVGGQPLTLKTLGELVQNPLNGGHATKYEHCTLGEYVDQPAKSHWALLTRTVIEGSLNKPYKDERAIIASYSQKTKIAYEIPPVLDAAVCNLMEYVRSRTWLYSQSPSTYTWCQEKYNVSDNLIVGGSGAAGFRVFHSNSATIGNIGVGGLRKSF